MKSPLEQHPDFKLVFHNRQRVFRRVALYGHVGLLESYFDGDVDIEGDIAAAFRAGYDGGLRHELQAARAPAQPLARAPVQQPLASRRPRRTRAFHYGLGTEFYRPWLDHPYMMYTCAYWKEGTRTLEEAQQNKMEHVCRKLLL